MLHGKNWLGAFCPPPPILNMVKVQRAQEARHSQFLFQNVQNNKIFEIFKMLKSNRWINVYYTKRKDWQIVLFSTGNNSLWVNLVQKLKIVNLIWNLVLRLIQTCRVPWWYSLFLFFLPENLFWVNLVQKIKIVSLSWNVAPRLIWVWKIQW